jgi:hypothetical protein
VVATLFVAALVVGIFVFDITARWWRENEWRRRWNRHEDDH